MGGLRWINAAQARWHIDGDMDTSGSEQLNLRTMQTDPTHGDDDIGHLARGRQRREHQGAVLQCLRVTGEVAGRLADDGPPHDGCEAPQGIAHLVIVKVARDDETVGRVDPCGKDRVKGHRDNRWRAEGAAHGDLADAVLTGADEWLRQRHIEMDRALPRDRHTHEGGDGGAQVNLAGGLQVYPLDHIDAVHTPLVDRLIGSAAAHCTGTISGDGDERETGVGRFDDRGMQVDRCGARCRHHRDRSTRDFCQPQR